MIVALLLALLWAGLGAGEPPVPLPDSQAPVASETRADPPPADAQAGDFALYARIAARMTGGEDYYAAALDEHRTHNFPAQPFITVRLPTLAWLNATIGKQGTATLAAALLLANVLAWQRRLRDRASRPERIGAAVFIFLGGYAVFVPGAGLIHEVIAGLLLSLSLALYRPPSIWPALLALGAALAVRELALPLALLWLIFAVAERHGRQALILTVLIALFGLALYLHYLGVVEHRFASDGVSPGWGAMMGPRLFLDALCRLTPLLLLPLWLAQPLALLPLLGWIGSGGRLGLFATLWFTGFALMMALFARGDNFYWVMMVLPAYGAGLAFVPRALADLGAALHKPAT